MALCAKEQVDLDFLIERKQRHFWRKHFFSLKLLSNNNQRHSVFTSLTSNLILSPVNAVTSFFHRVRPPSVTLGSRAEQGQPNNSVPKNGKYAASFFSVAGMWMSADSAVWRKNKCSHNRSHSNVTGIAEEKIKVCHPAVGRNVSHMLVACTCFLIFLLVENEIQVIPIKTLVYNRETNSTKNNHISQTLGSIHQYHSPAFMTVVPNFNFGRGNEALTF